MAIARTDTGAGEPRKENLYRADHMAYAF